MLRTGWCVRIGWIPGSILLFTACAPADNQDLVAFIEQTKMEAEQHTDIEPLPVYEPHIKAEYTAQGLRSPFESPQEYSQISNKEISIDEPDFSRTKTSLEHFALAQLKLVGTLQMAGTRWALIRDPSSKVHRVKVNDYLGQHYGQIKRVRQDGIDIVEAVANGRGGWIERPQSINMQTKVGG